MEEGGENHGLCSLKLLTNETRRPNYFSTFGGLLALCVLIRAEMGPGVLYIRPTFDLGSPSYIIVLGMPCLR